MKTITKVSLLLFLVIIVASCEKNYAKELTTLSQKLVSEGKQILYQTKNITRQDHNIIYVDGDKIMLDNIDSTSTILSGNSIIRIHTLVADFLSDGEPIIKEFDVEEDTLSKYLETIREYRYDKPEIQYQCINGDYLLIGLAENKNEKDLICIKRPFDLYRGIKLTNKFDDDGNIIINIDGDFASFPHIDYDFPLLPDPLIFFKGACPFTWALTVNKQGEIISKADEIISHDIKIPVDALTKMDGNKNLFSTKYLPLLEKAIYFKEQQAINSMK